MNNGYQDKQQTGQRRKDNPTNQAARDRLHRKLDQMLDAGMEHGRFGTDAIEWVLKDGVIQSFEGHTSRREQLRFRSLGTFNNSILRSIQFNPAPRMGSHSHRLGSEGHPEIISG